MELKYSTDEQEDEVGFWELRRGPETLALLERICLEENWWDCFFFPEPAFEPFRHLFTRRADRGEPERGLHRAISAEGIYLETADHKRVQAFTLVLGDSGARLILSEV